MLIKLFSLLEKSTYHKHVKLLHVKMGHYWPASEMPFTLHFAGGPIVIRNCMLAGLHKHVQLSCGLRT